MAIREDLARKIAEAKTGGGGNRLNDGDYVLVVKRILCEDKFNGTFFIPECDVVAAVKSHPTVEPNREGSDVSFAWGITAAGKAGEAAKGNTKQFMCALLNKPESTPTEEIMKLASQYAGPTGDPDTLRARGMLIECSTKRSVIKTGPNMGKEGCFPRFKNIEQPEGEVAERKKKLDADRR